MGEIWKHLLKRHLLNFFAVRSLSIGSMVELLIPISPFFLLQYGFNLLKDYLRPRGKVKYVHCPGIWFACI